MLPIHHEIPLGETQVAEEEFEDWLDDQEATFTAAKYHIASAPPAAARSWVSVDGSRCARTVPAMEAAIPILHPARQRGGLRAAAPQFERLHQEHRSAALGRVLRLALTRPVLARQ